MNTLIRFPTRIQRKRTKGFRQPKRTRYCGRGTIYGNPFSTEPHNHPRNGRAGYCCPGWFMLHRIRLAMQNGSFDKLTGDVEVDETYIGGKVNNMHKGKIQERESRGRGAVGKAIVVGLLERNGQVRTKVVKKAKKKVLHNLIRDNVEQGANLYTDAFKSYDGLTAEYIHETIDHATEYVRGNVHTNGIENFWSLFKRALRGTYVNCDVEHLFRYLDEQAFRFNNRKVTDAVRFALVVNMVTGKRITFDELTDNQKFKQLKLWGSR